LPLISQIKSYILSAHGDIMGNLYRCVTVCSPIQPYCTLAIRILYVHSSATVGCSNKDRFQAVINKGT